MPKLRYPLPKIRYIYGAWNVYWRWQGEYYSVTTDLKDKAFGPVADVLASQFKVALAKEPFDLASFPADYQDAPALLRYRDDVTNREKPTFADRWLEDYAHHLHGEVSSKWADNSMAALKWLDAFTDPERAKSWERQARKATAAGDKAKATFYYKKWREIQKAAEDSAYNGGRIEKTTRAQAQEFLDLCLKAGNTAARRNRLLTMCSRFFKWAKDTERTRENPFDRIKQLKEARDNKIVYNTREERDRLIDAAIGLNVPDWVAVPIAYYTGCRREEVYYLEWENVDFERGWLTVVKTKTGKTRDVPIHPFLEELLRLFPEAMRVGRIVPVPKGVNNLAERASTLVDDWLTRAAAKQEPPIPAKRVGWNVFRHTFATMLAQMDYSIGKICAYMGNTMTVCMRHYTNFIPRNKRDEKFDRL